MQMLSVGAKFPIPPHGEGSVAIVRGGAFSSVLFMRNLTDAEVEAFQANTLRYGLFTFHDLPVLLFDIEKFGNFDVTINLAGEASDVRQAFLDTDANMVTLVLCDYPSGIIRAMRVIGVTYDLMNQMKAKARLHRDAVAVDRLIDRCYRRYTNKQMIQQTDMIAL